MIQDKQFCYLFSLKNTQTTIITVYHMKDVTIILMPELIFTEHAAMLQTDLVIPTSIQ